MGLLRTPLVNEKVLVYLHCSERMALDQRLNGALHVSPPPTFVGTHWSGGRRPSGDLLTFLLHVGTKVPGITT